jgi:hypothetical protein
MLPDRHIRDGARELPELSRTLDDDGVQVRARCFSRQRAGGAFYEVLIDGFGQYAVIDVSAGSELERRIMEAMEAFVAAAKLRRLAR